MALQYPYPRYSRRHSDPENGSDSDVAALSDLEDEEEDDDDGEEEEEEEDDQPYPGFVAVSLKYLDQTSRPRNWCLAMITNPYPLLLKHVLLKEQAVQLIRYLWPVSIEFVLLYSFQ